MKTQSSFLAALFLAVFSISPARGEIIFQDGFENPTLDPAWVVTATNDGRVVRSQDFSPATGNGHMVMDDGVTDTMFSSSEATLTLNMRNKKSGVLTFKAKSLGDEPHAPPTNGSTLRLFDAVSVSTNGGLSWRSAQSLAGIAESWQTFTVDLDAAVAATGGRYDMNFMLRFSQYDNGVAGIDGIAIDDVVLNAEPDQRVLVELPSSVKEGSVGNIAHLVLSIPPTESTTVALTTTPVGQLVFPASINIPAGETVVMVKFKVNDDSLVNLARNVTVTPSMAGATPFGATVVVLDNEEQPQMSLTLPAEVTEGLTAASNASVSLSMPAVVDATVSLATSPVGQVTVPTTVKIPAGQTSAVFTVQATNDTVLDGDVPVAVSATLAGVGITNGTVTAVDNELPALDLVLPPALPEGQTATGSVTISVARANDLLVNITSASTATLGVTAQVTIPSGQTSATFTLTTVNNTQVDLSRSVLVSAAGTGVSTAARTLVILDDEPAPVITLSVPPILHESGGSLDNASVTLSSAADVATTVTIFGAPAGQLELPGSVTIPAGQTVVNFTARAYDDLTIEENVFATVTASAPGLAPVSVATTLVDNEVRTFWLALPTLLNEGEVATGTVHTGKLLSDLVVTLSGDNNPSLLIPSTVTIKAGQSSATFNLSAVDNVALDGTRNVIVTASEPTFISNSGSVELRDNDAAAYQISGITDIVNIDAPVQANIAAIDVENNIIPGFSRSVGVELVFSDGSTTALTPAPVSISGETGWSGTLTLPSTTDAPLKLRVTDTGGIKGESLPFETMRMLAIPATDLVWDASRSRIYASVGAAASGTYANRIVAIDPATALVTGSVVSNKDPGKLALTSGGEFLYAAQHSNGTVAKINPSKLTVTSSFVVGSETEKLHAHDMCTVPGQPNLLVVSRDVRVTFPSYMSVAVYDNGTMRPDVADSNLSAGSSSIEPSSDPTLFFGYNNNSGIPGFKQLQLTATGITQLSDTPDLFDGGEHEIRSSGNKVFSSTGVQVNGLTLRRLGTFNVNGDRGGNSPVCPDNLIGCVFFLETSDDKNNWDPNYDLLGIYDTTTMERLRHLTLPRGINLPSNLIRWGANGLAFIHKDGIAIINSKRLVQSDPQADLRVNISEPDPANVGSPLDYTITVTNDGVNPANNIKLSAAFSDSQKLSVAASSAGSFFISGLSAYLSIPGLESGASATFTVRSTPLSAGMLTCVAHASSDAIDSFWENNTDSRTVTAGFIPDPDSVYALRLAANNLVHDASRNLLWAAMPDTVEAPLGRSIVSINPSTGLVSEPIALGASPYPNSMAVSENGRYLYVGLSETTEVGRVDLQQIPPAVTRIKLGLGVNGYSRTAKDIEVLPGDGTSFLMVGSSDSAAAVYDGTVRRTIRTAFDSLEQVEPTGSSSTFIGRRNNLVRLSINNDGVSIIQTAEYPINVGFYSVIRGAGNTIISSNGQLINSANLELLATLPQSDIPALDESYKSVYQLQGSILSSFRSSDGRPQGSFRFTGAPHESLWLGGWALNLVRWGPDGFAATGKDGKIYIARWSGTKPANLDFDGDNIADAWEETHFRSLTASMSDDLDGDGIPNGIEWFFASSPARSNGMPITTSVSGLGASRQLVMFFPRRADIPASAYRYQYSSDLTTWVSVAAYSESVLSTSIIDDVSVQNVRVAIPFPSSDRGMVRIAWLSP